MVSTFIFEIQFKMENTDKFYSLNNIGETENTIEVILSYRDMNQEDVYQVLKKYLNKYSGNLYCSDISSKYIYFTNRECFTDLSLIFGRFYNISENESDMFLSTKNLKDIQQIGQIADFAGDDDFEIRTIKSVINKKNINLFDRYIKIQIKNKNDIGMFINDLDKEGIIVTQKVKTNLNVDVFNKKIIFQITGIAYLLCALIIFYSLLNSYKRIGIEKLLGYSEFSIYSKRMSIIILCETISIIITTFSLGIYHFKSYNNLFILFLCKLAIINGLLVLFAISLLSVPFLYIKRIKISDMLKNKNPVNLISNFNTILKIALAIIMILLLNNSYNNYIIISSTYDATGKNWEHTKEYAVISQFSYKSDIKYEDYSEENMNKQKSLFLHFNKSGAIYANFQSYSPNTRKLNSSQNLESYKTDKITVNINYLKKHPVYDENGNKIMFNESATDYIILVPEKYHIYENQIIKYAQDAKNLRNTEKAKAENQKIKIYWTKSNQNLFSYRLDINPNQGNCVSDPIIRVLTESNGFLIDYYKVLGYSGKPFKIKVNDQANPAKDILPKIDKYYDSKYFNVKIDTIYGNVREQIQSIKKQMTYSCITVILLCFAITFIILQNILNYFSQHSLRLAVQKLHGYRQLDKYKSYMLQIVITWFVILVNSFWLAHEANTIPILVFSLFTLEFIITILLISYIEKRKIIKIVKGG